MRRGRGHEFNLRRRTGRSGGIQWRNDQRNLRNRKGHRRQRWNCRRAGWNKLQYNLPVLCDRRCHRRYVRRLGRWRHRHVRRHHVVLLGPANERHQQSEPGRGQCQQRPRYHGRNDGRAARRAAERILQLDLEHGRRALSLSLLAVQRHAAGAARGLRSAITA